MDKIASEHVAVDTSIAPNTTEKRKWRAPSIVEVGGVLDLTEAVGGNLSDSGGASPPSYVYNT